MTVATNTSRLKQRPISTPSLASAALEAAHITQVDAEVTANERIGRTARRGLVGKRCSSYSPAPARAGGRNPQKKDGPARQPSEPPRPCWRWFERRHNRQ